MQNNDGNSVNYGTHTRGIAANCKVFMRKVQRTPSGADGLHAYMPSLAVCANVSCSTTTIIPAGAVQKIMATRTSTPNPSQIIPGQRNWQTEKN